MLVFAPLDLVRVELIYIHTHIHTPSHRHQWLDLFSPSFLHLSITDSKVFQLLVHCQLEYRR